MGKDEVQEYLALAGHHLRQILSYYDQSLISCFRNQKYHHYHRVHKKP